jgi:hypothetical protein
LFFVDSDGRQLVVFAWILDRDSSDRETKPFRDASAVKGYDRALLWRRAAIAGALSPLAHRQTLDIARDRNRIFGQVKTN